MYDVEVASKCIISSFNRVGVTCVCMCEHTSLQLVEPRNVIRLHFLKGLIVD